MTTFFHVVSENVARNPVARAVQKTRMAQTVRDFQLALYMLPDGSEQAENLTAAAKVLTVAIRLCEVRNLSAHESGVLRGALSAVRAASERGFRWRTADAVAIDAGMDRAQELVMLCSAQDVRDAWLFVEALA